MQTTVQKSPTTAPKPAPQITLEAFKRRYLEREDRYKYEWVRGEVIKTSRNMNQTQMLIWRNLFLLLEKLKSSNNTLGFLTTEVDTMFIDARRRPDIAYFTRDQMNRIGEVEFIPPFVVEVVSTHDQHEAMPDKLYDYRRAGVEIVWFVFMKRQEVHVYRGKQMTICLENDPCSAEPVIDGFVMAAADVFKKIN